MKHEHVELESIRYPQVTEPSGDGTPNARRTGSVQDGDAKRQNGSAERSLWMMLCVNSVLTIAELACGVVGNSLSLLADGMLMAMDGVSYCISLWVERRKAAAAVADRAKADRLGAFISVVLLVATTCWMLFDVVDRLVGDEDDAENLASDESGSPATPVHVEEETSGELMIIFTVVNIVADGWIFFATMKGGGAADEDNMNLSGAFAHLAADFVRGVAVLLCGILAVTGLVQPSKADAYCSVFVCLFVLSAAASMLRTVVRKSNPVAYSQFADGQGAQVAIGTAEDTCKTPDGSVQIADFDSSPPLPDIVGARGNSQADL